MEWYEINSALDYQYYSYKESWEQTRLIAFILAQVNSKKRMKLEDIIKFPWDGQTLEEDQKITPEDIERLNKMSEAYIKSQSKYNSNKK